MENQTESQELESLRPKNHYCQFCEDKIRRISSHPDDKKMLKIELGKIFELIAEYDKHIDSGGKLDVNTYRTFKISLKTKAKNLKQFHLNKIK